MSYDLSKWHGACGDKQLICGSDGISIFCHKCQVLANVEAISAKISPAEACLVNADGERKVLGDQSANVNKGANVK